MSKEFFEREAVAEQYYSLISMGRNSENDEEVRMLRARLNELEEIIGDDLQFAEILKQEREVDKKTK